MAEKMGEPETADAYDALEKRAANAYIKKLWTGQYFRYAVKGQDTEAVMAEQLAGQWYADLTGLGDLVPKDMRVSALHKVYDTNVRKFAKGEMGAVNGIGPMAHRCTRNDQIEEVWTGTTFGVASHMIAEGLKRRGLRHRQRRLQRGVARPRILLPHPRSLRHPRPLPRQHVHAARLHLGDGVCAGQEIIRSKVNLFDVSGRAGRA